MQVPVLKITGNYAFISSDSSKSFKTPLFFNSFAAIVATVFAYEGWIVATSINAELKNPKKNLPIALVMKNKLKVYLSHTLTTHF